VLTVSCISKSHGARVLFADVSFQVSPGRRLALVGPNGAGKTTLLEMLVGDQQPDSGQITRPRDLRIGYLRQDVAETKGRSVLAEVMAAAGHITALERRLRELEALIAAGSGDAQQAHLEEYGHAQERFQLEGGYELESRARRILGGLGFSDAEVERDVGLLSGGWMMRVALARLLLSAPDVLLLDEPTNHLDLDSVTWLEEFLAAYPGAIVLVSHDRDFINAIANHVLELAFGSATEYVGDYAAFVEQRALRQEQLEASAANQARKVAQTEKFIERFRYKASKARQVQSRIKALDRLERIEVPGERTKSIKFRFPEPPRSGREVVRLESITKRYGEKTVYDGLDLVLERGQKIALVGPNGAGKSTLLKILAGVLPFDAGRRELGHNVTVSYYAQHALDALDPDNTVLQELAAAVDTSKVNPRTMLGSFLFSGEAAEKRIAVLSGGEKSRLALAKMLANPANLLCIDEPTNHLDIASRDVLEDAMVEYPGTIVLITHDRHLIRSVADTIIEVSGGTATTYLGDFEYYADKAGIDVDRRGAAEAASAPARAVLSPVPPVDAGSKDKRLEAERRNRRYRQTKELRTRLARVEKDLAEAEAEVAELTRTLADPGVYDDADKVKVVVEQHGTAKDRAAVLMAEWEHLFEAVERVESSA